MGSIADLPMFSGVWALQHSVCPLHAALPCVSEARLMACRV